MEDELGRFGHEVYPFDSNKSHPSHEQWKSKFDSIVVGRGNGLAWWTDSHSHLAMDRFGGVFKEDRPHVWMDFNNLKALGYLNSSIFREIIIDWSTWRYMFHNQERVAEWYRLLDCKGRLIFETGISSFKIVPDNQLAFADFNGWHYDCDNFTHAVFAISTIKKLIPDFPIKMNQRVIIPAENPKNKISVERQYWNRLRDLTADDLNAAYEGYFTSLGWRVSIKQGFPIKVTGIHLLAGGIAGCCEALACHPLDTIKVRLQLRGERQIRTKTVGSAAADAAKPKRVGFIGTGISIVQKEGFLSLYKGLGAVVTGIVPKMAIRFSSFEYYKEKLTDKTGYISSAGIFLAGLGAGATESVMVVTPMDVIKIRLQAQRHSMTDPLDVPKYRNAAHCAYVMVKEEGIASLYKGVTLTIIRQ
ncbi:hypothetical protein HDV01_004874, partial [Terramyces sp. JEL0728]